MVDAAGLVDRRDLAEWARSKEADHRFPRLIRRLILETGDGLTALTMPADEGVSVGGWDGVVRASNGTHKIPAGVSVWEFSTEESVNVKANSDYVKRTAAPDGLATTDVTYVAAILRPWKDREAWATARTAEGRWKAVIAYGLDDVMTWLDDAPATRIAISEERGFHPTGVTSGERWWATWQSQTRLALPPSLVLAGREADMTRFAALLDGRGRVVTVGSGSAAEAAAFVLAYARAEADAGREELLARTVVVNDRSALRRALVQPRPLMLVLADSGLADEIASDTHHHVVVPMAELHSVDVRLGHLDADEIGDILRAAGLEYRAGYEYGRLARRSLTTLRRKLAVSPALHRPSWATGAPPRRLRAILLAGGWREDRDDDKRVLAELAGEEYETLREHAAGYATQADPLVGVVSDQWELVAPDDAWPLLVTTLTADDVKRFETSVRAVLGETDPATTLPREQRFMAATLDKSTTYSPALRRGLARSLALMGAFGGDAHVTSSGTAANWASSIVRDLLADANADASGRLWQSLSGYLQLLAEAAPGAFLDQVEKGVNEDDPVLRHMFADGGGIDSTIAPSYHSGLLWALETLAWNPSHLGRVADILARLEAIDPGGSWSNRPFGSLASLFSAHGRQTFAATSACFDCLSGLLARHPQVGWRLLFAALRGSFAATPNSSPRYRDWRTFEQEPDAAGRRELDPERLCDLVIVEAGESASRWQDVLQHLRTLPSSERMRALEKLTALVAGGTLGSEDTEALWSRTVDALEDERAKSEQAPPVDAVHAALQALADQLAPTDPARKFKSLFDQQTPRLDGISPYRDYAAFQQKVNAARQGAVARIDEAGGLAAVRTVAAAAKLSWSVGVALADATGDRHVDEVVSDIDSGDPAMSEFARAFMATQFRVVGWSGVDDLLDRLRGSLRPTQTAQVLLAVGEFADSSARAEAAGEDVAAAYWRRLGLQHVAGAADLAIPIVKLLEAGRPGTALLALSRLCETWTPGLVSSMAECLEKFAAGASENADEDASDLSGADVRTLVGVLEEHRSVLGTERVAILEWTYLSALGFSPEVPSLELSMAQSSARFVEVVTLTYNPERSTADADAEPSDGGAETEIGVEAGNDEETYADADADTEKSAAAAERGWRLLRNWSVVPGTLDGRVDAATLDEWYDETFAQLGRAARARSGLSTIGRVLAQAPPDEGEPWPPLPVRDLLERARNEWLEDGVVSGLLEEREAMARAVGAGGARETIKAAAFRESEARYASGWPRTAVVLARAAELSENSARHDEARAEIDRQGIR